MTIDRTALRRLLSQWNPPPSPDGHKWTRATDLAPVIVARAALANAVPDLLDELDAKDRRIAELEGQVKAANADLSAANENWRLCEEENDTLHIATESNANDRKRIAELEAGLATIRADLLSLKANNDGASPATCERIMKKVDDLLPSEET